MRKKITSKSYKYTSAKKEFVQIAKLSLAITATLLLLSIYVKYQSIQQPIYTATSTPELAEIAPQSVVKAKSGVSTDKLEIVSKIAKAFPDEPKTMLAIAMHESQLNPHAVGYNCRYKLGGKTYDKITHTYIDLSQIVKEKQKGYVSTYCRDGDQKYAWSTDGSIYQINNPTAHEMTVDGSIASAQVKYDTQGKNAWVSYKTGAYKKYLPEAEKLLAQI